MSKEHTADRFRGLYEQAAREAFEDGKAILDRVVERAEARRRFHVDSQGCTVITYVDAGEEDGEP